MSTARRPYQNIPTASLNASFENSIRKATEWLDAVAEAEAALAAAKRKREHWATQVAEQATELVFRERVCA